MVDYAYITVTGQGYQRPQALTRFVAVIGLTSLALWCGSAQGAPVYVTGVGLKTCGEWGSNPHGPINDWILGYWTGLNESQASTVGYSLGVEGILHFVLSKCITDVTLTIRQATGASFVELRQSKR